MIKTLEMTGRTEEQALEAALKELKLDRDEVSLEILQRAKSGFLGIGAVPAKILVKYEVPDEVPVKAEKPAPAKHNTVAPEAAVSNPQPAKNPDKAKPAKQPKPAVSDETVKQPKTAAVPAAEKPVNAEKGPEKAPEADEDPEYTRIREFLSGLFSRMGIQANIAISPRENGGINVELSGSQMGAVIGRRGETLDAIQHLTNYVINRGNDKHMHISIDAEAYRSKREESLTRLAEKMAEKAIKYKRSMALEPMNSYERHVIHTALQNYEGVTTASTGEEPNRRVIVSYVRTENEVKAPSNKPKSREWA